jgi:hypothetical protein
MRNFIICTLYWLGHFEKVKRNGEPVFCYKLSDISRLTLQYNRSGGNSFSIVICKRCSCVLNCCFINNNNHDHLTDRSRAEKLWLVCGVMGDVMLCDRERDIHRSKPFMLLSILKKYFSHNSFILRTSISSSCMFSR